MLGKVKWFNKEKGFGFLMSDDKEFFVHHTDIKGEGFKVLNEGQSVSFEVKETERGLRATEVLYMPS